VRENTAAIDIGDDDDRTIDDLGEAHVGDVAGAQIDFGRATGAFDDDAVVGVVEALPGLEHGLHRPRLVFVVIAGIQVSVRLALDDHLRMPVGRGLEQDRIEVDMGRHARRQRLQRLGAADFAAIDGDGRIERHVLRFKGRDAQPATGQNAADGCGQHRFSGIGRAALDHQGGNGFL